MKRNNNPQWNKFEAALLLEALLNVKDGRCTRKEAVTTVSNRFRNKAILDKVPISDTYRNVNGITLQLAAMDYAYTNGARGVKHVNKLFYETVDLYRTNPQQFKAVLQSAKEMYPLVG